MDWAHNLLVYDFQSGNKMCWARRVMQDMISFGGEGVHAPSLPYAELLFIHNCLRQEITQLQTKVLELVASGQKRNETAFMEALRNVLHQFDFFYVVYHSHSKAEDDVIMPALMKKGLDPEAEHELKNDHCGQTKAFEDMRLTLLNLRTDQCKSFEELGRVLEYLANSVDKIKASVYLHFKKEEEELFPLLTQKLDSRELEVLAGHILGNRSSYLVNCYLEMIIRDLPESDKVKAIESIVQTAQGTRFSNWLKHISTKSNPQQVQQQGPQMKVQGTGEGSLVGATVSFFQSSDNDASSVGQLGCKHYRRRCKLYFPCCKELFCCRLCHDETVTERSVSINDHISWHQANRYELNQMWCMVCNTFQNTGKNCTNCKTEMAYYFCPICNLFDDDSSHMIYHCPFCNVCRRGQGLGVDMYHCMKCNACVSVKLKDHTCVSNSMEGDCPICLATLFDSTEPVQHMNCGHFMHRRCYNSYITTNFQCPMCRKSVHDMSMVWKKFDSIWAQLPRFEDDDYVRLNLHCNDCQASSQCNRSANLPESLVTLPNKCPHCGSYNTRS